MVRIRFLSSTSLILKKIYQSSCNVFCKVMVSHQCEYVHVKRLPKLLSHKRIMLLTSVSVYAKRSACHFFCKDKVFFQCEFVHERSVNQSSCYILCKDKVSHQCESVHVLR